MRPVWAPVLRSQVRECIILFPVWIEMRAKYADCPVTVIIEGFFAYLVGGKFSSLLYKLSLMRSHPILMSPSAFYRLNYDPKKWAL